MNARKLAITVVIVILVIGIGAYEFISANSHDTRLQITSNSTLKNGDYITVVLKDEFRNVYPDQMITIKILDDSGWGQYYNGTTDETGTVSFLLEGMENGNYTVHATFNGTMFLQKSKTVSSFQINDGMN